MCFLHVATYEFAYIAETIKKGMKYLCREIGCENAWFDLKCCGNRFCILQCTREINDQDNKKMLLVCTDCNKPL